jgi:hypothetical protein
VCWLTLNNLVQVQLHAKLTFARSSWAWEGKGRVGHCQEEQKQGHCKARKGHGSSRLLCTLLGYLYPCFCCVGEMWRRGVVFTLLKIYLFCSFVWVNGSIFGAGIVLQF